MLKLESIVYTAILYSLISTFINQLLGQIFKFSTQTLKFDLLVNFMFIRILRTYVLDGNGCDERIRFVPSGYN